MWRERRRDGDTMVSLTWKWDEIGMIGDVFFEVIRCMHMYTSFFLCVCVCVREVPSFFGLFWDEVLKNHVSRQYLHPSESYSDSGRSCTIDWI